MQMPRLLRIITPLSGLQSATLIALDIFLRVNCGLVLAKASGGVPKAFSLAFTSFESIYPLQSHAQLPCHRRLASSTLLSQAPPKLDLRKDANLWLVLLRVESVLLLELVFWCLS